MVDNKSEYRGRYDSAMYLSSSLSALKLCRLKPPTAIPSTWQFVQTCLAVWPRRSHSNAVQKKSSGRKWTADEDDLLVNMHNDRKTIHDMVCALPDRSRDAIYHRLYGVPRNRARIEVSERKYAPRATQKRFTDEEDARIEELRAEGLKWREVARGLPGRTGSSVQSRWHKLGYGVLRKPRSIRGALTPSDAARIEGLLQKGSTWQAIAEQEGDSTGHLLRRRYQRYKARIAKGDDMGWRKNFRKDEDDKLLELRAAGMSFVKIQEHLPTRSYMTLGDRHRHLISTSARAKTKQPHDTSRQGACDATVPNPHH